MFKRLMIYNPAKYNMKDEIDLFTFSTLAPPPGGRWRDKDNSPKAKITCSSVY